MDSFLLLEDEDMDFIWNTIQDQQVIFHPRIAPDGKIDFDEFYDSRRAKPYILFIDRNILSSFLKLCEKGSLKNKGESQLVGLIMTWAEMNDVAISAGLAVMERASSLSSQKEGLLELRKFQEAYDAYPGQMWLHVAEGRMTDIKPVAFSNAPAKNITVDYASGGDHFDMALASLLHAVLLFRDTTMKPVEKVRDFFLWSYENLLVGEYLLVYVSLLFTGSDNIKAPKNANSDDLDKIVAGCENQAWDISYLTLWSTLYSEPEKYREEFLFATNDVLLKRIFINKNGPNGLYGLLSALFSKKECAELWSFIEEKMKNRTKPNFGENPHMYFQSLIEAEKAKLSNIILPKENK